MVQLVAISSGAAHSAAMAAGVGFLLVAGFQVALALGAPWGSAAWGGAHEGRLPRNLRIASAIAAVVWILLASLMFERAGHKLIPLPFMAGTWVPWGLFGLLAVGTLMNLVSRSRVERLIQTPTAAILAILCLLVALGS